MRIGVIIFGSPEQTSGGYLYDRKLAEHLREAGSTVDFLSLKSFPYIMLPVVPLRFNSQLCRRPKGRYDALIIDELCHPAVALKVHRLKKRFGCPVVVLVHHLKKNEDIPPLFRPFVTFLERKLLEQSDGIIVNSTSTKREIERVIRTTIPMVIARPAGNRFREASSMPPPNNDRTKHHSLRVLFVGNIIPRKGLHTLIDALTLLKKGSGTECSLTVVGSTEANRSYVRRLRRLISGGDLSRVAFLGPVGDDELADLYQCHDILCVPSVFEGFGIVYLEAMHFGLPAIGTTAGGAVDIIRDGENGFLIDPGDAIALKDRIQALGEDAALIQTMATQAHRTARNAPTWHESMDIILTFLIKTLQNHSDGVDAGQSETV